jgi:hypothetical protein
MYECAGSIYREAKNRFEKPEHALTGSIGI